MNNAYIFNLCVTDRDILSWKVQKLAVKLIWNWSLNICIYRKQLYINLKCVRPYACLFYHPSWVEWTGHMSFYLLSICTFSCACLFTVHHCSRKITSLWLLTPLISQSYFNIWRYLRSCITKRAQYLLLFEVQLMFIFGMKICHIFNNNHAFVNDTSLRMRIEWLLVGFIVYCLVFTWDILLWRRKGNSRQSQQFSCCCCCCCCCKVYCNMFWLFFYVHTSVHRKYISKVQPTRCNVFLIYLFL
jgi:hypothetical protein